MPNLKYFFDYQGKSIERFCCGIVSFQNEKTALVVPKLDEAKAKSSSADNVFPWTDSDGYVGALNEAFKSVGVSKRNPLIGCEDAMTLGMMESLKKAREGSKFEMITDSISALRVVKDEDEIRALLRSAEKLCRGYRRASEALKLGRKESEAAFEMNRILLEEGAVEVDFCAVQSGANGAIPHLEKTEKKIASGDSIVMDISCVDDSGYFADFTRTYVMGEASNELKSVYAVVQEAQSAGVRAARSGAAAQDVDRAARNVIDKAGYGPNFFHRVGHGIGLEVHEAPWITKRNRGKLRPGMAFTVEPGIYLPGKFGVRIEDNLITTESETLNLTDLTHELTEL